MGGDSNNKDEALDVTETPTSKQLGKRPAASVEGLDSLTFECGQLSATKEAKIIGMETEDSK
jgi:hypothetical protein